jgi:hypothetical protein
VLNRSGDRAPLAHGDGNYIASNLSAGLKPNTTCDSNSISGYLGTALQRDVSGNRDHVSGGLAAYTNGARNANHVAHFLARVHDYGAAYLNQITRLFGRSHA